MSSFFDTRKRREYKMPSIDPITVLVRHSWMGSQSFVFESQTVVGLKYKVKTKPELINDQGKSIYLYGGKSHLYHDTPENRELLERARLLRIKVDQILKEISLIVSQLGAVDSSKLYERITVNSKELRTKTQ